MQIFGYDVNKRAEGVSLLNLAKVKNQEQIAGFTQKLSSNKEFRDQRELVTKLFSTHLKLARIVLRAQPLALQKLGADGPKHRTYSKQVVQIETFYLQALADTNIQQAFAVLKITPQILQGALDELNNLKALYRQKVDATTDSKKDRIERDEAMDAIDLWMDSFIAVAKIVFEDAPLTLSRLNI